MLFHLANAAMLPLVGSILTTRSNNWATVLIAACIVAPQIIVALFSPWVGRQAGVWGRCPLLLVAFGVLPIRGVLFAIVSDPYLLVVVQLLDGITAAVLAITVTLMIADLTRGTGHFNLGQGVIGTAAGPPRFHEHDARRLSERSLWQRCRVLRIGSDRGGGPRRGLDIDEGDAARSRLNKLPSHARSARLHRKPAPVDRPRGHDEEFDWKAGDRCEKRRSLFFDGPGTLSAMKRRSPNRSHRQGGHGTSYRHSTTAGSTNPIRRGAGVPDGRGRTIWCEWLILVRIPIDRSDSCIGSSADDGSHMSKY
jgi:hypothetical protein